MSWVQIPPAAPLPKVSTDSEPPKSHVWTRSMPPPLPIVCRGKFFPLAPMSFDHEQSLNIRRQQNSIIQVRQQRRTKMRCMIIVKATEDSERGVMPSAELLAAMGKYNEE